MAGDRVLTASGEPVVVAYNEKVTQPNTTVYNFEVADTHSYFVGESGVWVHNYPGESKEYADSMDLIKDTDSLADLAKGLGLGSAVIALDELVSLFPPVLDRIPFFLARYIEKKQLNEARETFTKIDDARKNFNEDIVIQEKEDLSNAINKMKEQIKNYMDPYSKDYSPTIAGRLENKINELEQARGHLEEANKLNKAGKQNAFRDEMKAYVSTAYREDTTIMPNGDLRFGGRANLISKEMDWVNNVRLTALLKTGAATTAGPDGTIIKVNTKEQLIIGVATTVLNASTSMQTILDKYKSYRDARRNNSSTPNGMTQFQWEMRRITNSNDR